MYGTLHTERGLFAYRGQSWPVGVSVALFLNNNNNNNILPRKYFHNTRKWKEIIKEEEDEYEKKKQFEKERDSN